jgi:5-methyltetrahydrofolate--homocysteine methyltransferase
MGSPIVTVAVLVGPASPTHARGEEHKRRVALAAARANALKLDWRSYRPPRPRVCGITALNDFPSASL